MLTKAITAENNENAAVTARNMTVVNHNPGSITSSVILPGVCRICVVDFAANEACLIDPNAHQSDDCYTYSVIR